MTAHRVVTSPGATAARDRRHSQVDRRFLQVVLVTPLGHKGRGGIDRLNDSVFDAVAQNAIQDIRAERLVTRGQIGLIAAQPIFAFALAKLVWLVLRGRADVLHIHLSIKGSSIRKTIVGAFARLMGVPYVVHLHGTDFGDYWRKVPRPLGAAIDRLFEGSAQILVLGQVWSDVITHRLPHVADRVTILANATSSRPPKEKAAHDVVRVSFLGKIGSRKGTPDLIEALARLRDRTDWQATLAGDGEVSAARDQVRLLGIDNRCIATGWLGVAQRDALLSKTDILVLPSLAENLPMVIIEAMACGIAVIATPVGAIPEVIEHERNGLLVPAGNIGALSEAVARLIADPELRERLGAAGRKDHEDKLAIDPYMRRLTAMWRDIAASTRI